MKITLKSIILCFSILSLIFIVYAYFETRWIKVQKIDFASSDIPKSFEGKKIIFVTDIHHGPFFSLERVTDLVRRINKLNPDIIILGGDYTHRDAKFIKPFFDEFSKVKSKYGVYGVLGNHDHWEGKLETINGMTNCGFHICDNESYWVKIGTDSIKIGGVGDLFEDDQILEKTIKDVSKQDFCILISHNPDYFEKIKTNKIDFALAGHTHGGQITLFGLWAPVLPIKSGQKYRYGMVENNNFKAYVSSGVGTVTPPLRFFCRPEIVEITLHNE